MLAATNESVNELNRAAQRLRVDADEIVQPIQRATLADGAPAMIGDEAQTRRNERSLTTDAGITVKNRHRWVIKGVEADGSVTVFDDDRGRVTLPPQYVAESVTLGYAPTAMAGQGRTVDHSLVLVDGPIDAAGLYVPMTRGPRRQRRLGRHLPGLTSRCRRPARGGDATTLDRRAGDRAATRRRDWFRLTIERWCPLRRPKTDLGREGAHDRARCGACAGGEAIDVAGAAEERELLDLEPRVQLSVVPGLVQGADLADTARPVREPARRRVETLERPSDVIERVTADGVVRQQLPEVVDPLGEARLAQPRIVPDLVKRPANERAQLVGGAAVPDHLLDRATDVDEGVDVASPESDLDLAARGAVDELPSPPGVPARGAGEHGPDDVRDLLVVVLHDTLRRGPARSERSALGPAL